MESARRSPGQPVNPVFRTKVQAQFGHDFGSVRVHTDVPEATLLGAKAFTSGQHIFFAPGAYEIENERGQNLLAHELVHTIQHGPDGGKPFSLSRAGDALEVQADNAVRAARNGHASGIAKSSPAAASVVSRRMDENASADKPPEKSEPQGKDKIQQWRVKLILRQLATDADDRSGRVRSILARLESKTRESVLDHVRDQLSGAQAEKLATVLEQPAPADTHSDTTTAPVPELGEPERLPEAEVKAKTAVEAPAHSLHDEKAKEADNGEEKTEASERAPVDALEPTQEGAPKQTELDTQKAEEQAKKKGPEAPKGAEGVKPAAAAGGAGVEGAGAGVAEAPVNLTAVIDPFPEATPAGPVNSAPAPVNGAGQMTAGSPPSATQAPTAASESSSNPAMEAPDKTSDTSSSETAQETATEPTPGQAADTAAPVTSDAAPTPELESVNAPDQQAQLPATAPEMPISPGEPPASLPEEPTLEPPVPEAAVSQPPQSDSAVSESDAAPPTAQPSAAGLPVTAAPSGVTGDRPQTASSASAAEAEDAGQLAQEAAAEEMTASAAEAESKTSSQAVAAPVTTDATPDEGASVASPAPTEAAATGVDQQPAAADGEAAPAKEGCGGDPGGAPSAEAGGEGGAGGVCGGGGGAIADPPVSAAPDVAQADPAAAMGAVADLPPAQLQSALGGVSSAASHSVSKQKDELTANPPQMERPSGVPAQRDPSVPVLPPGVPPSNDKKAVDRADPGEAVPIPAPDPLPPSPASPTQGLAGPRLPGEAPLTEQDAAKVQEAVSELPTTDPALQVDAGPAPSLSLEGNADPKRGDEQRAKVEESTDTARQQGLQDVAQPMGESNIYPTVPKEKLTAKRGEGGDAGLAGALAGCVKGAVQGVAGGQGGGGKAASGDEETYSIVAREKKGDEIKAAALKAQGDMTSKQQEHAEKVTAEKTKSQKDVDGLIEQNAAEQKTERTKAREESLKIRTDWNTEQQKLQGDAKKDALSVTDKARTDVSEQQTAADKKAAEHIDSGNKDVETARKDAEKKAADEKKKAEKESSGVLGWLSSKVSAFFDSIKDAIKGAFDAARKFVKNTIEKVKKLATEVIETARKAVVGIIKLAGDALIAIGDRVLAGFPNLRDKFRKAVKDRVQAAEDYVNKLADKLKKGVQDLLDALGNALDSLLGLLECGLLAAVDAVKSVVKGAIDFAKNVVEVLGTFAVLIKDIASNPGQWLSNLGTAVVDGLKHCFWDAFKSAVKNWFNSKLEEVLGLGLTIFQMLFKGCIKMAEIGKMAWEALKAAIPSVLIQLLIEKLVSMIVPAAGAIMTIIEGLRAAWGTVSRIIAAIGLFVAFLKAVKSGNGAGKFAAALAAAGIVLIDFVANWLLQRLRKPASAVAGKLKAMAAKIGAALKKGLAFLKKGAAAAGGAIKRGAAAVGRAIKQGAQAVGRGLKKVGHAIAKTKVGQAVIKAGRAIGKGLVKAGRALARSKAGRLVAKGVAKVKSGVQKIKKWFKERKKGTPQERLDRAMRAVVPKVRSLTAKGVSKVRLYLQLAAWGVFYGLKKLAVHETGQDVRVRGVVNPEAEETVGTHLSRDEKYRVISGIGARMYEEAKAQTSSLGESTGPQDLEAGQDPTRLAVGIQERPEVPGMGKTVPFSIGGENVFGKQGSGKANVIIAGLGTYPQIQQQFANLALKDKDLAKTVFETLRTGKGPVEVKRLIALMFGTETARSDISAVTARLTVLGLHQGSLTSAQAFGAPGAERPFEGGIFPPSQDKYVAAHKRTQARLIGGKTFREGTQVHARSEENINRTIDLVTVTTEQMFFKDEPQFTVTAEKLMKDFAQRIRFK